MRAPIIVVTVAIAISTTANAQEIDWKKIDDALGRSAAVTADVHRYGFPRTDLSVTLDGVAIKPALALGGWTAFKPTHGGAMLMGDLVLLESEITPVMTAATPGRLRAAAASMPQMTAWAWGERITWACRVPRGSGRSSA